jgi:hypothetical protein
MSYPTYHNTTNLNGQQLKEAVISASNQDAAILLIYKQTRKRFTPWDIHGMCVPGPVSRGPSPVVAEALPI